MMHRVKALYIAQISQVVFLLINTVILLAGLPPEERGKLAALIITPSVLIQVLTYGRNYKALIEWTSENKSVRQIFRKNLAIAIWNTAAIAVGIAGAIKLGEFSYLNSFSETAIWISVFSIIPLFFINASELLVANLPDSKAAVVAKVSQPLVTCIVNGAFFLNDKLDHNLSILSFTIGACVGGFLMASLNTKSNSQKKDQVPSYSINEQKLRFYIATGAEYLIVRVQGPILSLAGNFHEAGIYAVATSVAEMNWYITSALRPVLIGLFQAKQDQEKNFCAAVVGVFCFGLLTSIGCSNIFLPLITNFQPQYSEIAQPTLILIIATFLLSIGQIAITYLQFQNLPKHRLASYAVLGAAIAILIYALSPSQRSALNMALASLIAYGGLTALAMISIMSISRISAWKIIEKGSEHIMHSIKCRHA